MTGLMATPDKAVALSSLAVAGHKRAGVATWLAQHHEAAAKRNKLDGFPSLSRGSRARLKPVLFSTSVTAILDMPSSLWDGRGNTLVCSRRNSVVAIHSLEGLLGLADDAIVHLVLRLAQTRRRSVLRSGRRRGSHHRNLRGGRVFTHSRKL